MVKFYPEKKWNYEERIGEIQTSRQEVISVLASLLSLIGLALTIAGIVFLIGRASLTFVIPFDWFGVIHYFMIFVGLFLIALDRMGKLEPNGSFWGMKHSRAKK